VNWLISYVRFFLLHFVQKSLMKAFHKKSGPILVLISHFQINCFQMLSYFHLNKCRPKNQRKKYKWKKYFVSSIWWKNLSRFCHICIISCERYGYLNQINQHYSWTVKDLCVSFFSETFFHLGKLYLLQ